MFNDVVKILEEFEPAGLLAHDFLGFPKVLKVLVVCVHPDWVLRTQKVGSAAFEAKDDACKFFIVGIIVLFCWLEASRVECNGVDGVFKFLHDYSA